LAYNTPISFGGRVPLGPTGGAHNAPPDTLAGFIGREFRGRKNGRREKQERGKERRTVYTKWGGRRKHLVGALAPQSL